MSRLLQEVIEIAKARNLNRAAMRRITAALRTLDNELDGIEFIAAMGEKELAQKVTVPGDDAVWIVTGMWEDGSMDIIREEGSFISDVLVGWRPGQSRAEYDAALEMEEDIEVVEEKKNVPPLRAVPDSRRV